MEYEITKEMREKAAEILNKKEKGELKFMSASEFEKRSLERLEQIINSKNAG